MAHPSSWRAPRWASASGRSRAAWSTGSSSRCCRRRSTAWVPRIRPFAHGCWPACRWNSPSRTRRSVTESLSRRQSPWPVGWPTRRRCAARSMPGGWRCGGRTGWRNAPPWPKRSCAWHGRPATGRWNWTATPIGRPARWSRATPGRSRPTSRPTPGWSRSCPWPSTGGQRRRCGRCGRFCTAPSRTPSGWPRRPCPCSRDDPMSCSHTSTRWPCCGGSRGASGSSGTNGRGSWTGSPGPRSQRRGWRSPTPSLVTAMTRTGGCGRWPNSFLNCLKMAPGCRRWRWPRCCPRT